MLSLGLFLLVLALGMPVALAMTLGAVTQILASGNGILLLSLPQQFFQGMENYGLLALPVFILLGEILNATGAANGAYALAARATRNWRGGMAQASLLANGVLAAVLGSTAAQITLMSRLSVPQMERAGYSRATAAGLVAAGSLLAPVIPPSMLMIVFAVIAQVPVGDLFMAGLGPGLLMLAGFALLIDRRAKRGRLAVSAAAPVLAHQPQVALGAALRGALPALAVPCGMIAAIMAGIATPVKAGVVAIAVTLLIAAFGTNRLGRQALLRALGPALVATARLSGAILFLVAAASLYAWVIAYENVPARVAETLTGLSQTPLVFLLLVNLLLLGLGMICDPIPALILTVPVLLPVAVGHYGIDPVSFGLICCLNLTIGLMTPPVGVGLYTAALQNGLPAAQLIRVVAPFLAVTLAVLALVCLWPDLPLLLPRLFTLLFR